jgi:uncharacterized protein (TIGR02246 family)
MGAASPEAVAQAFVAAVNDGDLTAALDLWLDDAVFVTPDGAALQGKAAIRDVVAALVQNGTRMRIEMAGCHVAGPAAVAHGTLTFTVPRADAEPAEATSRFTAVYAQGDDGSWRIAVDAPWGFASA